MIEGIRSSGNQEEGNQEIRNIRGKIFICCPDALVSIT